MTTTMDFGDGSDNPSYATQTIGSGAPVVSVYGSSIGGDLGFTVTGGAAALALADPHGDTITTMTIPTSTSTVALLASPILTFDEYGNQAVDLAGVGDDANPTPGDGVTAPATGALTYGYLGAKQRATDTTGLVPMGARLYNPATGQFTSMDPVPGGNTTAYVYPQDPINAYDIDGECWFCVGSLLAFAGADEAAAGPMDWNPIGWVAAGVGVLALGTAAGIGAYHAAQGIFYKKSSRSSKASNWAGSSKTFKTRKAAQGKARQGAKRSGGTYRPNAKGERDKNHVHVAPYNARGEVRHTAHYRWPEM